MLRKIAIILIAAFLKYNPFARALIVLLILGVAIYVQTIKKPYFSNILNEMEYRAIIVSLFTIYFGLYYYVTPDDYAQVITIVVILTSNIYFLYYWLMHMIISNYEYVVHLLRHIPPLQRFVIGIKSKYDAFTRILSSKRVKTTRNMKSSNSIRSVNEMLDSKLDSSTNKISIDTSKKIFPKAKKNNKE